MTTDDALYRFRLRAFALASELGNVRSACRAMGIHPSTFYRWRAQDGGLVVAREDGSQVHPERLSKWFAQRVKKAGLPAIRLHDLRHTHATHLLSRGIHPKVVQERLGHASIVMTLDLYSHVVPGLQEQAAAEIGAILGG